MNYKTCLVLILVLFGLIAFVYLLFPESKFEGVLTNEVYLSPNDKEIIYVYEKEGTSKMYRFEIGDTVSKLLIDNVGYNLSEPSFTIDNKRMIYRVWKKNDPVIHLFVCNSDGKNSKEIYSDNLLFSPKFSEYDAQEIYFIKASEYSNHSLIAKQHPNGMDLYSCNLKNKKIKKLTEGNYYAINSYDFISGNSFFVNCDLTGIYKYTFENLKKEKLNIKGIDSSSVDQIYNNRISYSKEEKKYLLSSNFEVYLWDGKDSKPTSIFISQPGVQIKSTSFFKNEKRIFISDNIENITIIDYKGKVLSKFKIPYPSF
ncbi:hypothetical protein SAMN05444671_3087 [Flavobacterium sp. CF108]|uniref:hypothetical protein n=1 Tax=unclassified Flavobacterium TaxID=196869 RepID=UPI0008ABCC4E|nr:MULTISPECIES: hypothetical protein [unclassified Flavobacterium]SEP30187.1 hypothetical protein SAMN04487978_0469 [Flavobacterium sp. fv08]SHH53528.1 hypothetical protein SAMN05444671_3087 [Flavobacterium sp. CF108]